ncbi:hypothetical protein MF672_017070 [Actinomadura sp. ATCC 31491]|uniref:Secreted protein n=1 Tax=Actinomadura luzonensis TaxID=2805427 RepID=A0ABT0FT23_9ACTN|nr:hypothetical protein [Actinomadura luzonensis]MCK2215487.1 hypothetical protein [Actinomadura luzonensis]
MRVNRRRLVVAAVIVAVVAAVGVPGPAVADSAKDSRLLSLTSSTFFLRGAFGSPWKVGDCHLEFPSYVSIESGQQVHLHAVSDTDFTRHADVWHSRFDFLDAQQRLVVSVGSTDTGPFDSPDMVPAEGDEGPSIVYEWDRRVILPNAVPSRAVSVRWLSAC